jgi:hypothetical protein
MYMFPVFDCSRWFRCYVLLPCSQKLSWSHEGSIEGEPERGLRFLNEVWQPDHPVEELDWLTKETGE